jgi:hypothetical protein
MKKAVIVAATRTAIGTFGGALAQIPAPELGAIVIREALRRAGNLAGGQVDEVILGNVLTAGLGLNPGRVAYLKGGIPQEVPGFTINKACGSGLKAVALAAQSIEMNRWVIRGADYQLVQDVDHQFQPRLSADESRLWRKCPVEEPENLFGVGRQFVDRLISLDAEPSDQPATLADAPIRKVRLRPIAQDFGIQLAGFFDIRR